MSDVQWRPVPVPQGDGRHDIGDDVRAAIYQRLYEHFTLVFDIPQAKAHHMAMFSAASVRALLHELGTLKDMGQQTAAPPERVSEGKE